MQVMFFHNDGFVIHKLHAMGRRFSVWFDASGKFLDCERTDGAPNRKPSAVVIREMERVARPHVKPRVAVEPRAAAMIAAAAALLWDPIDTM